LIQEVALGGKVAKVVGKVVSSSSTTSISISINSVHSITSGPKGEAWAMLGSKLFGNSQAMGSSQGSISNRASSRTTQDGAATDHPNNSSTRTIGIVLSIVIISTVNPTRNTDQQGGREGGELEQRGEGATAILDHFCRHNVRIIVVYKRKKKILLCICII